MNNFLIIGSGVVSLEHTKCLKHLFPSCSIDIYTPLGRSKNWHDAYSVNSLSGSVDSLAISQYDLVIIASPVETLYDYCKFCLASNAKRILCEKPGFVSVEQGQLLKSLIGSQTYLRFAYNRRFFKSLQTSLLLSDEQDLDLILFDASEWSHKVSQLTNQSQTSLQFWGIANSCHLIDMALIPININDYTWHFASNNFSDLSWHPTGSTFSLLGHPIVNTSACSPIVNGYAGWTSPGRWSVEWRFSSQTHSFKPIETLSIVDKGTVNSRSIVCSNDYDSKFKPGFLDQLSAICGLTDDHLTVDIHRAIDIIALASRFFNYL